MEDHPLFSSRLKIDRAKKHFSDLNVETEAFASRKPYKIVLDEDSEPGIKIHRLHVVEAMPPQWSCIIGDTIHNLRSSLDALATALVALRPDASNELVKKTYFPIGWSKRDLSRNRSTAFFEWVGQDIKEAILSMQPYRGGKGHALWLLDHLDITDKHRRVVPIWARLTNVTAHPPVWSGAASWDVPDAAIPNFGVALEHGDEIVRVGFFEPHFDTQTHFTFEVAFTEPLTPEAYALAPTLLYLINFTEKIVADFENRFFSQI